MMKKAIVLFLTLTAVTPLLAGDDKPIQANNLPSAAREFIERHFTTAEISLATIDKELWDTTYEVFFTDGRKIEFDKNGQWKEIDCKYSRVPESAVPGEINRYLAAQHPGRHVREIDRDRRDYEVKLDNGLELKFDLRFQLIGYDD